MKKVLLLVFAVFAVASTVMSQGSGSMAGDITTTITDMERMMIDAIKNGEWETFESHMGDEFLGVYGFGISDRNEELESLRKLEMRSYDISDVKVVQPSENVAIIAYKLSSEGTYMDEDFSGNYYASTTWVNDGGTWKAVMHTESKKESTEGSEHEHEYEAEEDSVETDVDSDTLQYRPASQ